MFVFPFEVMWIMWRVSVRLKIVSYKGQVCGLMLWPNQLVFVFWWLNLSLYLRSPTFWKSIESWKSPSVQQPEVSFVYFLKATVRTGTHQGPVRFQLGPVPPPPPSSLPHDVPLHSRVSSTCRFNNDKAEMISHMINDNMSIKWNITEDIFDLFILLSEENSFYWYLKAVTLMTLRKVDEVTLKQGTDRWQILHCVSLKLLQFSPWGFLLWQAHGHMLWVGGAQPKLTQAYMTAGQSFEFCHYHKLRKWSTGLMLQQIFE